MGMAYDAINKSIVSIDSESAMIQWDIQNGNI
jgi:hypothetical protein